MKIPLLALNRAYQFSKTLGLLFITLLSYSSFAQTMTGTFNNLTPEANYTYGVTGLPASTSTVTIKNITYAWQATLSNQIIFTSSAQSIQFAWPNHCDSQNPKKLICVVKWDAVSGDCASTIGCTTVHQGTTLEKVVAIKCISPLSNISINNSIYSGSTVYPCGISTITLRVDPVTTEPATSTIQYTWTLPSGWSGGGVYGANGNSITATTNKGGGGIITVQAKRIDDSYTVTKSLSVGRPVPTAPTITINGDAPIVLCSGQSTMLVASGGGPSVSSYTWTPSSTKILLNGSNAPVTANSVTVSTTTGISGAIGSVSLVANSATCGISSSSVSTSVWAGPPDLASVAYTGTINNIITCAGNAFYATASAMGSTSFDWIVTGGTLINGQGSSNAYIQAPGVGQGVYIEVWSVNSCGRFRSSYTLDAVSSYNGQYCFEEISFMVYPNPGNAQLTIASTDKPIINLTESDQFKTTYSSDNDIVSIDANVKLVDQYNQTLWEGKLVRGKTSFSTMKIPNGLYYLKIGYGKQLAIKQVLIQH